MSRIELHCPSCGYDVLPTLMPPPEMFSCPGCLEVMPRDKLTKIKVLNRRIAGVDYAGPFQVTRMGVFKNEDANGTAVCPFTLDLKSNELFIAVIGSINESAGPTAITLGASDTLTMIVEQFVSEPAIGVYYFNGELTNPGLQTLTITYGASFPSDILVAMLKITGHAASPIDKSAILNTATPNPTFTSGNTTALTLFDELAIGGVVAESNTVRPGCRNSFVEDQYIFSTNLSMVQARRQLKSKAAIAFTGTDSDPNESAHTAAVVTIKPR